MLNQIHRFSITFVVSALTALTGQGADKDYTGKELPYAKFAGEVLNRAKFDRANLEWADFSNASLKNASFQGANLLHARFRNALLEGADFSGAKLQGARFTDAKATNANFSGTEIHFLNATLDDAKAAEILGQFADKSNGTLSFQKSNLRKAVILGDVSDVDFRWTDVRGTDFRGAKNLDNARFKGAQFDETTQWNLDTEKAGAVRVKSEAPKVVAVKSPFVGNWSIYQNIEDPTTAGELQFSADHTYSWRPLSSEAKILSGKWSEAKEDQLALADGELGKTWSVRRIVRANGKSYLELKSGDGETRIALPR